VWVDAGIVAHAAAFVSNPHHNFEQRIVANK
jgi:hypothetical protein